jgi:hypothetical protein
MLPATHLLQSPDYSDITRFSTQGASISGLGLPFDANDLDNAFGAFNVLPGGSLVTQSISKYPFANQFVAANAVIREPITVSVIMDAPMRGPKAFATKLRVMTTLKGILDKHNNLGGTYIILTPAYLYTNMVMTSLTDNSRGNNSLPQNAWRWDFERPLIALEDLQQALNSFTTKMQNQVPTSSNTSGISTGDQTGQTQLVPGTQYPSTIGPDGVPIANPANSPAGMITGGTSLPSYRGGANAGVNTFGTLGFRFGGIS